jgi:hypothetical protein
MDSNKMTVTLYTLQLTEGHYYVGRTERDVYQVWFDHLVGTASIWTKRYKPINLQSIKKNASPQDELDQLNNYFTMYGYRNVHTDDLACYRCGFHGHYEKTCKAIWHINGFNIDEAEGEVAR